MPNHQPYLILDPGHGGTDPGASYGGAVESEINLSAAGTMAQRLQWAHGARVDLTRYTDEFVSLRARSALENERQPDAFISIHCNAASTPAANGIEVWTSPGQTLADPLATSIYDAIHGPAKRQNPEDGDPDREARFAVLVHTRAPAVLVELGFLTNAPDRARLMHAPTRHALAWDVVTGIMAWWTAQQSRANKRGVT